MNNIKFYINDQIYIKKYKGNCLKSDTNKIYIITFIETRMLRNNITGYYEKYAILNNGNEQLLLSYNYFTKKYNYYVEHIPWYHNIFCNCFFY